MKERLLDVIKWALILVIAGIIFLKLSIYKDVIIY